MALALLRRLQQTKRPDLQLIAMSATLDAGPVAEYLGCPVIRSEGKRFDVTIEHLPPPTSGGFKLQVSSAVRSLVQGGLGGHVLVFLPGAAEIRRAMESMRKLANEHDLARLPLHGDLSPGDQDRAVGPSSRRKVILSTNVAESSVTIEGSSRSSTVVSCASCAMLRGPVCPPLPSRRRAARPPFNVPAAPGEPAPEKALRLYTRADFDARPEHDSPEIQRVDLLEAMLDGSRGRRERSRLARRPQA